MANVVLFHHVLGLTEGMLTLAGHWRAAGHDVMTPDLFEGERFTTIDDGVAHLESIGFPALIERGEAAVSGLAPGVVFAGVSMGVICAQQLAQTRSDAAGAVLMESCLPPSEFGEAWPDAVPVQIHGMSEDPFFAGEGDIDNARAIVASSPAPLTGLFVYPGDRHLFVDSSVAAHDPAAATLVIERTLEFLAGIDAR